MRGINKTLLGILAFYAITNLPYATYTFTRPESEIKTTLSEQLKTEMDSLYDISGGAIFSNFEMLGTCMGYGARKLIKP